VTAVPPSLETAGTTWRLACAGCPDLTITLWDDATFWVRRGPRGAGAEIRHGWWERRDSTAASATLALYGGPSDRPTFVVEARPGARPGAMRVLGRTAGRGASARRRR
jgi:hypothetical protein